MRSRYSGIRTLNAKPPTQTLNTTTYRDPNTPTVVRAKEAAGASGVPGGGAVVGGGEGGRTLDRGGGEQQHAEGDGREEGGGGEGLVRGIEGKFEREKGQLMETVSTISTRCDTNGYTNGYMGCTDVENSSCTVGVTGVGDVTL